MCQSTKSFRIRTSTTPLLLTLYNLHLEGSPASAANKEVTAPLESALTKNGAVTHLESKLSKQEGARVGVMVNETLLFQPHCPSSLFPSLYSFRQRARPGGFETAECTSQLRCAKPCTQF